MTPQLGQQKNGSLPWAPMVVPGETGGPLAAHPGKAVAVMVPPDQQIFHQDDVRVDTRLQAGMTSAGPGLSSETWIYPMRPSFIGFNRPSPPAQPPGYRTLSGGWAGGEGWLSHQNWINPMRPVIWADIAANSNCHPALRSPTAYAAPLAPRSCLTESITTVQAVFGNEFVVKIIDGDRPTATGGYGSRSSLVARSRDDTCGKQQPGSPASTSAITRLKTTHRCHCEERYARRRNPGPLARNKGLWIAALAAQARDDAKRQGGTPHEQ